jgi:SAM-dependent methyltransferase
MTDELSLDEIRDYWTNQAHKHGRSPAASWSDHPVIDMEIRQILKWLQDGDKVLDVGCANGHSTLSLAAEKNVAIRGLDYIPEMIEQARNALASTDEVLRNRVDFAVGEITRLPEPDRSYDKVLSIRVLINLRSWDRQREGIQECIRVLKPGGLLLLSEAILQGWKNMNAFRAEWGLPEIPMPSFNQYLDEDRVVGAFPEDLEPIDVVNFASTYYVGTRVIKPLLARVTPNDVDVASPDMEWNRFCSMLPPCGDYGTQKLLVFRRRK